MTDIFNVYNTAVNINPVPKLKECFKFTVNSGSNRIFNLPARGQIPEKERLPFNIQWHIEWGDDTEQDYIATRNSTVGKEKLGVDHSYPQANTNYQVTISPIDSSQWGWMIAFGSALSYVNSNFNDKIISLDSPLTLRGISWNSTSLPNQACYGWFYECSNLTMGPGFNLPQDASLTSLGNSSYCFASMFYGCSSLDLNNIFTFPQNLKILTSSFADNMFAGTAIKNLKNCKVPQNLEAVTGSKSFNATFNETPIKSGISNFFGSRTYSQEMLNEDLFYRTFQDCSNITEEISPDTIPALTISKSSGTNYCFFGANSTAITNCPTGWK